MNYWDPPKPFHKMTMNELLRYSRKCQRYDKKYLHKIKSGWREKRKKTRNRKRRKTRKKRKRTRKKGNINKIEVEGKNDL